MPESRNRQLLMEHLQRGVRTEVAKSILRHAGVVGNSVQDYLERLHQDQTAIKTMDRLSSAPTPGLGLSAPEPMEVDQLQGGKEEKRVKKFGGKCFRCSKVGHMKKDCKVRMPEADKKEAVSALLENRRQQRPNTTGKILTVTDSTKAEREVLYKNMVPGDAELSLELMDGPADNTRWMNVPRDPPFQCSMMGAVERIDKGKCTMTVLEGVVVSEEFISLLGLSSKHLTKKGGRNISTADPKGPGLKVVGRVKKGLMGIRFCEHETRVYPKTLKSISLTKHIFAKFREIFAKFIFCFLRKIRNENFFSRKTRNEIEKELKFVFYIWGINSY